MPKVSWEEMRRQRDASVAFVREVLDERDQLVNDCEQFKAQRNAAIKSAAFLKQERDDLHRSLLQMASSGALLHRTLEITTRAMHDIAAQRDDWRRRFQAKS
jgi:uncharacterized coiled-coil DUF342 family protein